MPHTATRAPGHRFYEKLNELLTKGRFDTFVEALCAPYYDSDSKRGRVSIPPGTYGRMLLIGYFEGLESEQGMCWRCEDSLSLRAFLGLNLTDRVPDHSTLSRTRHRLHAEVFSEVFTYILKLVHEAGLLQGKVVDVDSMYLRADASQAARALGPKAEGERH
ncbi:MAG: transposase [Myxococcales bacterium]|nr:transposase [Myxococcales bacterium]